VVLIAFPAGCVACVRELMRTAGLELASGLRLASLFVTRMQESPESLRGKTAAKEILGLQFLEWASFVCFPKTSAPGALS
jgi:hypothetical protein